MSFTDADGSYTGRGRRRHVPRAKMRAAVAPQTAEGLLDATHPGARSRGRTLSIVGYAATQDWIIVVFFVIELLALALGRGPGWGACMARVAVDLLAYAAAVVLARRFLRRNGVAAAVIYRLAVLSGVLGSYLQLREILPAVSSRAYDAQIYAFDLRVFGVEPALWFDQFVSPSTTEWFAFFYFLYFLILSVHVLPLLVMGRDPRLLARFTIGILLVFLSAHLLYMAVPGWGPYWFLKGSFRHELHGGLFWRWVREAVDAGGAQKDIFPSLHTAGPTFVAIFSFRHRDRSPFKYTWPLVAFFATQIMIATLFLRWHYVVDVIAGLVLAALAAEVGQRLADWEHARRERLRLGPAWMPPIYPWSRPSNG